MPRFNGTPLEEQPIKPRFGGTPVVEAAKHPPSKHLTFEEGQALLEAEEHQQRIAGPKGAITAGLTGFVDGVPIAGPAFLGGTQRGAALVSTVMNGGTYDENLQRAQGITQQAQAAHPWVTTGANLAGATAGTIPLVMAAPAAFGAGSGSFIAKSGISALSGGALGEADKAVRSEDYSKDAGTGFRDGFVMGAAGPTIGKAVGAGARTIADAIRNRAAAAAAGVEPQALNLLRRAAVDDGLDGAMIRTRLNDMGPDAVLADLGPNLQKQAGALASMPGKAQEVVRTALIERQAGANGRIASAIDDNLGPRSIVPRDVDASLQANQQTLGPQYGEVFQKPTSYDFTPITDSLDKSIQNLRGDAQKSLQAVRSMMNVHNTKQVSADPRIAFETRQAIDGMLANEANPKVIGILAETRQMLDDALQAAVPRIKEVDANFAELGRQREALQRGQTVLSSGREAPRPSELVREVQEGALPQNMQIGPSAVPLRLSQGARAEVERIVGNNSNDVAALHRLIKGEGDWNRDRLATLFGKEKADRLLSVIDNERVFADTANTVMRNSETAARMSAQSELGGAGSQGFGTIDAFKAGGVRGAVRAAAVDKVAKVVADISSRAPRVQHSLGKALVEKQREELIRAITIAQSRGNIPATVDMVTKALLIGAGASGAR